MKLASIVENVQDKIQHFNMRLKARDKATMLVAMNNLPDDRKGSLFINIYKHRPMPKGVGAASRVKKPRGGGAANRSRQETTQASGDDEGEWADDESEEGESEESEEEDSEEENAAPAAATAAAAAPPKAAKNPAPTAAPSSAVAVPARAGGASRGASGAGGVGVGPSRQPLSPVVEPVSRDEGKTSRASEKARSPSCPDDDDDFM